MPEVDEAAVGRSFREECGRSVASLVRAFGDIGRADEARLAYTRAAELAPSDGEREFLDGRATAPALDA